MYNMSVWVGDDILSFLLSKFDVIIRWVRAGQEEAGNMSQWILTHTHTPLHL